MKRSFILVFMWLPLLMMEAHAQDFEGDSIYYTPIPIKVEKKSTHKTIFRDTIKNDQQFTYFFNLQVGNLIGCTNCDVGKEVTFTTSTTHGVIIGKKLRVGAGIGFDSYYNWQTMPLFGSASWDLFGTKNTNAVFIQANYGWAQAWQNKSARGYGFTDATGGRTANILIGYRVKYHDLKLSISVGSKFQRAHAYFEYPTYYYRFDGTVVQGPSSTKSIQQDMNRLMFAVTIGWK